MPPAREFAIEIVRRLRGAGFLAYWAGGCVRDELLGLQPKDYDVATDASPERIREVFGRRRTLAIGAAFGVITVLGRKNQGQIEVATFREDADYSDGRHPDSVRFSTPEHDAQRRDFTINGLFYDPLDERVIDYVGGQRDLEAGIVRAIGDADARINEDKLRMLRAVRFAATYAFTIDPETFTALQRHADQLRVVSAERIAEEMRRMLRHVHRARAVRLLHGSCLLSVVLPEAEAVAHDEAAWGRTLAILDQLGAEGTFCAALAALLREAVGETGETCGEGSPNREHAVKRLVGDVAQRWRLSKGEKERLVRLLRYEPLIRRAKVARWPQLQRVLIDEGAGELVDYCAAVARVVDEDLSHIDFCRAKLALPPEALNPPPLITGDDLKAAGIPAGKIYRDLLTDARDAQLEGEIRTPEQALQRALTRWKEGSP